MTQHFALFQSENRAPIFAIPAKDLEAAVSIVCNLRVEFFQTTGVHANLLSIAEVITKDDLMDGIKRETPHEVVCTECAADFVIFGTVGTCPECGWPVAA